MMNQKQNPLSGFKPDSAAHAGKWSSTSSRP